MKWVIATAPLLAQANRNQANAHVNPGRNIGRNSHKSATPLHQVVEAPENAAKSVPESVAETQMFDATLDSIYVQLYPSFYAAKTMFHQKPTPKLGNKNVGHDDKLDDTFSWDNSQCVPIVNGESAIPKGSSITGCDLWANANPQFAKELGTMSNKSDVDSQDLRTGSTCNGTTGRCLGCSGTDCGAGQICISPYYAGQDFSGCSCFYGQTPDNIPKSLLDMDCPDNYECVHAADNSPMARKNAQFENATFFMGVCKKKGSSACFSGLSSVSAPSGNVFMKDVKIGQEVKTAAGVEKVLGWVHSSGKTPAKFLEITHENGKLTLTPDHFIYLESGAGVAARDVQVGDKLAAPQGSVLVTDITTSSADGIYTPWTESNTVVVDGVVCSTFVDIAAESPIFSALADVVMRAASKVIKFFGYAAPSSAPQFTIPTITS